jgi:hypothetical protein
MDHIEIMDYGNAGRLIVERDDDEYLIKVSKADGELIAELPFSVVWAADEENPFVIGHGLAISPTDVTRVKIWARLNTEPSFDDVDAAGLDVSYGPYTWADLEVVKRIR